MKLNEKKVAILATDGFEESELSSPQQALINEGATVHVISPKQKNGNMTIKSWDQGNWGKEFEVSKNLEDVSASDYNALVLPGGVINPDTLRQNENAIGFIRDFFKQKKPVAAICHGPQLLIEADVLKDRKITSFCSIKMDLKNAGANWVDEKVVVDQGLVTSRTPDDLESFNSKLIEEVREGKHEQQSASV